MTFPGLACPSPALISFPSLFPLSTPCRAPIIPMKHPPQRTRLLDLDQRPVPLFAGRKMTPFSAGPGTPFGRTPHTLLLLTLPTLLPFLHLPHPRIHRQMAHASRGNGCNELPFHTRRPANHTCVFRILSYAHICDSTTPMLNPVHVLTNFEHFIHSSILFRILLPDLLDNLITPKHHNRDPQPNAHRDQELRRG